MKNKVVIAFRANTELREIINNDAKKANHTISQEVERLVKVALKHEKKLQCN